MKIRRHQRAWSAALGCLLVPAVLSACGSSGTSSSSKPHLVLYNGQHLQTTNSLVQAFEKKTGITVAVRSDDEAVLANQIITEGSRSPADVFYTENSPALEEVNSHGLLSKINPSTLAQVPPQDSSPTGHWVGVTKRVTVMAYNTAAVTKAALPKSILDLADPKWKGKIAIAPSETDFQPIVTSVYDKVGKAATLTWLEGLKANAGSHVYPDNESMLAAINSGQVELGVIEQYYWYRLGAEIGQAKMHSAIAPFVVGDPGYLSGVSGAGVLKSSKEQAAAQEFVAFLVSKQGQRIIASSDSFEYPLVDGVGTPKGEPAFSSYDPTPLDVKALGTGATALALLKEAQLL